VTAKILRVDLRDYKRVICVSDIHGSVDLFKKLLETVKFSEEDILFLLGDLYTKGGKPLETIMYIARLCRDNDNVYALRGNCDWIENDFGEEEKQWLKLVGHNSAYLPDPEAEFLRALPDIIETEEYIFVHAGLGPGTINEQDTKHCHKNDDFAAFGENNTGKWVVVGHMPTINLRTDYASNNPVIDGKRKIIAIDGGNVVKRGGQLNAFIIEKTGFDFYAVDELPQMTIPHDQSERGGTYNITWFNRFARIIEEGKEFTKAELKRGKTIIEVPNDALWRDYQDRLCIGEATDFYPRLHSGETVSVVRRYSDKVMIKKDGVQGWYLL